MAKEELTAQEEAKKTEAQAVEQKAAVDTEVSGAEQFLIKNKNIISIIAGVAIVVVGGLIFWNMQKAESEKEAQLAIYPAQYYFGQDSLDLALKGSEVKNVLGFESVAEAYSGTDAGNLANFYAGVIYMKKSQQDSIKYYDKAIDYLTEFTASDEFIAARALSLIGDCYMEMDKIDEAIQYYEDAVNHNSNEYFTPDYIMKLATAYYAKGDYAGAVTQYQRIIDDFKPGPDSDFQLRTTVDNAKKYKALAQGMASRQ